LTDKLSVIASQRTSKYVSTLYTPIVIEPKINPIFTKIPPSRVNGTPKIKLKRKSRNTILDIESEIIQRTFGISLKFGLNLTVKSYCKFLTYYAITP
jgi:hypothetical protein